MVSEFQLNLDLGRSSLGKHLFLFWSFVYVLVIGQDYIFSSIRGTGFYWSEVLLFNGYWLLFIPLTLLGERLLNASHISSKSRLYKFLLWGVFVFIFSLLHLMIFTSLITVISNLCFYPPHRFMKTLSSSISNDLYLTVLVYFFIPYLFRRSRKEKSVETIVEKIAVKKDNKQFFIDVSAIYYFYAEKPYVGLYTKENMYLLSQSLKELEQSMDNDTFLRIHRSAIVNKHYIQSIISRKNGDYDIVLQNDKVLRLSRHYRKNWEQLLSKCSERINKMKL